MPDAKFHITENKVMPCKAKTEDSCPLSGEHFNTIEKAQAFFENKHESEVFKSISKEFSNKKKDSKVSIKPYKIDFPDEVTNMSKDLSEIGKPLFVGGTVRDSLTGSENKDYDIEVFNVDLDSVSRHLKKKGYRVDEVGKEFGVLKVKKKGSKIDFDVSSPRTENKTGSDHRGFAIETDPSMNEIEASKRRDFTFNSIYYNHENNELIDPNGGSEDLKNRTLRHVSEKFAEDPLRVLRGFQFASRFNMDIHPETSNLCKSLRPEYEVLSQERVREEWNKFYNKSTNPSSGLKVLQKTGWDDTFSGLQEALKSKSVNSSVDRASNLSSKKNKQTVISSIIASKMNSDDRKNFLEGSLPSLKDAKKSEALIEASRKDYRNIADVKHQAREKDFNYSALEDYAKATNNKKLLNVCSIAKDNNVYDGPEKDFITGDDAMRAFEGRKPGPWMRGVLDSMRNEQYHGRFSNREEALKRLKQLSD